MGGITAASDEAERLHQGTLDELRATMVTGSVCARVKVRVRAKRMSFQAKTAARMTPTTRPGRARGTATRKKAVKGDPPSTATASSRLRGIASK